MSVANDSDRERKARIVSVRASDGEQQHQPSGRILLQPDTAQVVRKVARHCGWTLDELVQAMLSEWVPQHTSLDIERGK